MAVRIRLRRIGKRKQPYYRVVVADAGAPRDGRFVEAIGHYDPRAEPPQVSVDGERALWWLRRGAQPSDTVRALLVRAGVWEQFAGPAAGVAQPSAGPAPMPAAPEGSTAGDTAPEPETAQGEEPSDIEQGR